MILQNPYFRKGTFEDDGDIEVITLDEYDNFLQQVTIYRIQAAAPIANRDSEF